jgi:hypothetical protein
MYCSFRFVNDNNNNTNNEKHSNVVYLVVCDRRHLPATRRTKRFFFEQRKEIVSSIWEEWILGQDTPHTRVCISAKPGRNTKIAGIFSIRSRKRKTQKTEPKYRWQSIVDLRRCRWLTAANICRTCRLGS